MWLLECNDAFEGRRLWLRPGKTYLFGRTASEPGQIAISHNTISRKHLTISVDNVEKGHAYHLTSRSKVSIQDLNTKIGTFVNGTKVKGESYIVDDAGVDIMLGKCPSKFRLSWHETGFSFSFTTKEMRTEPFEHLREHFEPLDIKLLAEYNPQQTTHVVAKKRNTAKGLQALINGKHIVTESFLDAIQTASQAVGESPSPLEQDFDAAWPDAIKHLPPKGGEPVQHDDDIYSPDSERRNIFEGYTFVFYDKVQYDNLLAPITNGCGKALLRIVDPRSTETDEFIKYVKNVAGEKGLGSFDDGSEGKGVVLVRFLPAKGPEVDWYKQFITEVSLRLDHRPIEQNEFLEAILIKDASILRRPLEVEAAATDSQEQVRDPVASQRTAQSQTDDSKPSTRSRKTRQPIKRRFAGFDDGDDVDMADIPPDPVSTSLPQPSQRSDEEGGLFVSQEASQVEPPEVHSVRPDTGSKRKAKDDLMEGMAPAAERLKRQRIERGEDLQVAEEPKEEFPSRADLPKKKKVRKEIDVLAVAAQNREAEEARAKREKEELSNLLQDVDLSEIRRNHLVEEMPVRTGNGVRTREQDIADGRWDPRWNGMKNFKKFVSRGEQRGRARIRTIVPLTEVKIKGFGVGDDYWLDDESQSKKQKQATPSQPSLQTRLNASTSRPTSAARPDVASEEDESDLDDVDEVVARVNQETEMGSSKSQQRATRTSRAGAKSQNSQRSALSEGKRSAANVANEAEQPTKRPRAAARKPIEVKDSDESDDDLKFRFGKRR